MKTRAPFYSWAILVLMLFNFSSCGIVNNVRDITDKANQILGEVAQLSRTINSQVETGNLTASIGQLLDDRIETLGETVEEIIRDGSGVVFDEINGTIDNTFDNISDLLEDIKENILGGSAKEILESLSSEVGRHINSLSAHAEYLITVTAGNTAIIVSQATDAALTLTVWLIVGIGLVLFILVLIIWGGRMTKGIKITVYSLIIIFLLLCLGILFVPQVKAQALKTLDIGQEMLERATLPKITSSSPSSFELGTDTEIILHGLHLDGLVRDSIDIGFYQSGQLKLKIPNKAIKAISGSKIVLADFHTTSLNWKKTTFKMVDTKYKTQFTAPMPVLQYKNISKKARIIELMQKPIVKNSSSAFKRGVTTPKIGPSSPKPSTNVPPALPSIKLDNIPIGVNPSFDPKDIMVNTDLSRKITKIIKGLYQIDGGTYEIRVTDKRSGETVSSVQSIKIKLPPPPPPKPDIYPITAAWVNKPQTRGDKGKLLITLGVEEGQEIKRDIKVSVSSSPNQENSFDFKVDRSTLQNASGNMVTVQTRDFDVDFFGEYTFTINTDSESKIVEDNEANNTIQVKLPVNDYHFKAVITFSDILVTDDAEGFGGGDGEFKVDIIAKISGPHPQWKIDWNKDGAKEGKIYQLNKNRVFDNIRENSIFLLQTSGYEEDWSSGDDYLGSAQWSGGLKANESTPSYPNVPFQLRTSHYKVSGNVLLEKIKAQ